MDAGGAVVAELQRELGPAAVVTDPDVIASHVVDWTGRWRGTSPAVLRPSTGAEVAAIVATAGRHGASLVPQGGNSGLVGGSVPRRHDQLVLDLRRLDRLGEVDGASAQVTAGAGVTLAALSAHVAPFGLAFGVDLGARDVATIGGMVATNAGGNHVVRYGPMRHQVLGVDAVLADGTSLSVNPGGLLKDNTGYDLAGLLCGSEGTLAVITAARLRLVRPPEASVAAMLAYGSVADALAAAAVLAGVPDLLALEVMLGSGLALVAHHRGRKPPVPASSPAVLLAEIGGSSRTSSLEATLARAVGAGPEPLASAVAPDDASRGRLWAWREEHPAAAAALGVVHKADVTVPAPAMESFLLSVPQLVEAVAPGSTTLLYGHVGDGNVHVNVVGPAADDDRVVDAVLDHVVAHEGSVSAEHGIGVAKRGWLVRQRGQATVDAMAAIKGALDPRGTLNPGVLLPA
jgi:FAD/FMN-containing dehydrogenase